MRISTRPLRWFAPFGLALLVVPLVLFVPRAGLSDPPPEQTTASAPPADCRPLEGDAPDVCEELVELEVRDVLPITELDTHAIVLVSKDGATMLPIFVDEAAAVSIAFRLAEQEPPHPLAQDLLDSVVAELGGKVTEVRIDSLEDDVFVGRVVIRQDGNDHAIDARPSDSIAMAIQGDAPILANRQVLEEAGIDESEVKSLLEQELGVGGSGPLPHELPPSGEPTSPGGTIEL